MWMIAESMTIQLKSNEHNSLAALLITLIRMVLIYLLKSIVKFESLLFDNRSQWWNHFPTSHSFSISSSFVDAEGHRSYRFLCRCWSNILWWFYLSLPSSGRDIALWPWKQRKILPLKQMIKRHRQLITHYIKMSAKSRSKILTEYEAEYQSSKKRAEIALRSAKEHVVLNFNRNA